MYFLVKDTANNMDGVKEPVTEGNFYVIFLIHLVVINLHTYVGIHLYKNNILWVMSLAFRPSEMEN